MTMPHTARRYMTRYVHKLLLIPLIHDSVQSRWEPTSSSQAAISYSSCILKPVAQRHCQYYTRYMHALRRIAAAAQAAIIPTLPTQKCKRIRTNTHADPTSKSRQLH